MKDVAPFGVPNLNDADKAELLQHAGGDLAGELAIVLPMHILRAEQEPTMRLGAGGRQRGERRNQKARHGCGLQISGQVGDALDVRGRFRGRFVHLEVAAEIECLFFHLWCSRSMRRISATFGVEEPSLKVSVSHSRAIFLASSLPMTRAPMHSTLPSFDRRARSAE